jgi:hypothetical protein
VAICGPPFIIFPSILILLKYGLWLPNETFFQKQNTMFFQKTKHKTLFRKLYTPSYRNTLKKHMLIFLGMEANLSFIKKVKKQKKNKNRKGATQPPPTEERGWSCGDPNRIE